MKERGMIFNCEMVRALLDGRKTQTRRVVKGVEGADSFTPEWDINGEQIFVVCGEKDHTQMNPVLGAISCPFGAVGDRIWVRETFQGPLVSEELFEEYRAYPEKFETPQYCEYAADGGARPEYCDLESWLAPIHTHAALGIPYSAGNHQRTRGAVERYQRRGCASRRDY